MMATTSPSLHTAKPTLYGGRKFKSRLEATWAAFLDNWRISWTHEPFRVRLSSGVEYLPDFYLPDLNTWFEAKGCLEQAYIEKPMSLWKSVRGLGQKVVVGGSDGRVIVPHHCPGGTVSLVGSPVRCVSCGAVWFANFRDEAASACPCCGDRNGGRAIVAASVALAKAGLSQGWFGDFHPTQVKGLLQDAVLLQTRSERFR
jgi:hypothetical protein